MQAQGALQATEERLLRVVDASARLLRSMSVTQVMADTLGVAPGLVPCHAAAIWRENPDGAWSIVSSEGLSAEYVEESRGVFGPAIEVDQLMVIENTAGPETREFRRPLYQREGIGSLLGVPLQIRGGLSGTIIFYFREPRRFSESEREVARALGNVAAAALTTAETFEREAATRRQAEAGERRAEFVARAGATLHAARDMDSALAEVLQLAVSEVADQAEIEVGRDGRFAVCSAGHCDSDAETIRSATAGSAETARVTMRRNRGGLPWLTDDVTMLDELARRIGIALENTRLHREVREASERAHLAMEAAELGTWDIDVLTGTLTWSARTRAIFGVAPDIEIDRGLFYSRVHPGDRERVRESVARAADPATGASANVEYRVVLPDGSIRWIQSAGRALFEEDGRERRAVRMIGMVRDNTAFRLAEEERQALLVREQEARSTAELLNKVGPLLLSELDRDRLVEKLVEICTRLVDAAEGALSGEFAVWDSLRVADCHVDPSFATRPPFGNSSYRSLLAVPVNAHTGESFGTLVFAHPAVDRFGQREQQLAEGIAAQAAIALDNARLFEEALQVQEALHKANLSLRSANTDLEQFAFAAAHDLREPLRMVTSYTQLLERRIGINLNDQTKWMMQQIVEGASRMSDLLQDLLSYTNTATQFEPAGPVNLQVAVSTALQNLSTAIAECGAVVHVGDLPVISGRSGHMTLVFQNLIGNAIKYRRSDVRPAVEISAERGDAGWLFRVKDNGIGIAPQYQIQIFGVFKRLHGRDIPGTGIGLAICQRAIERAGGKIWVESTPGEGSTFLFTVPAPEEPESTEQRSEEE